MERDLMQPNNIQGTSSTKSKTLQGLICDINGLQRGEGLKNCPNLRDVIYECTLRPNMKYSRDLMFDTKKCSTWQYLCHG